MMLKDKRGIDVKVLVGVITLVVALIAILFIYGRIKWEGNIERQVCHQSIVLRSAPLGEKVIPLNCKTQYVCVTGKTIGKSCEDAFPANKKVSEEKAKTQDEINSAIAKQMYTAWTMLGKGELNFENREWKLIRYCFIDSRISFDESIRKNEEFKDGIPGLDVYLATYAPEGEDKPYLSLFSKGQIDYLDLTKNPDDVRFAKAKTELQKAGLTIKPFSLDPKYDYDLVYIIDKPGYLSEGLFWLGAGVTAVGVVTAWTGVGAGLAGVGTAIMIAANIVTSSIIKTGVSMSIISIIRKGKDANHELTLIQHDESLAGLRAIGCTRFETLSQ